ncbi:anti-sigma factor [Aureimonas psammosilenae]|uniref:anti-sigma factor n=1 Tax=Aureimonas psammosilenae TaxID=2495496 RepID=UPI001260447C|nr:anti-sigma factor [Aureimonas psammosilenae]
MSDTIDPPEDDDDLIAAEYALGLLGERERLVLERRMRTDETLRRRVEEWEERVSPLLIGVQPVEPPAGVLASVEAKLDGAGYIPTLPPPAIATAANDNRVSRGWKWLALGTSASLVASLAMLFVVTSMPEAARDAPLTTVIAASGGGGALYAAVIDPETARATLVPVVTTADPRYARQLWAIAPNAQPRSLGLLPLAGSAEIGIAPELLAGGVVLAISQEPPGGSPTGQPTGPVVGTGQLQRI